MTATGPRLPAIDNPLPPDLIARFRADLASLWSGEGRLGIAVSGGPDSLALLLLAHAAMPGQIAAATVDHGLRPESVEEAAMVADLCRKLGVPHAVLQIEVPRGNVQHEARTARYATLAAWMRDESIVALATAHHADDQAETLMMRLNRGSGLSGLAGVRARGNVPDSDLPLVRPLLGWRKAELEKLVRDADIAPAEDPSNKDMRFDRARMRAALADADWLDVEAVARSASWLADADAALDQWVERVWSDGSRPSNGDLTLALPADLPREVRLRLLARAMEQFGAQPRGSQVAEMLDAVDKGETRNLAGVIVVPSNAGWVLRREPPRR